MYVDGDAFLGQTVATLCRPGEIITRDGCEPSGATQVQPLPQCPPGTQYHAPTDACQVIPCPDGWVRHTDGTCVPLGTPPPNVPALDCPPGTRLIWPGTSSQRCEPIPGPTEPQDPGSPPRSDYGPTTYPVPLGFGPPPPPPDVTVTVDAPARGFGLLEVLIAGGLGLLVSRAVRDKR